MIVLTINSPQSKDAADLELARLRDVKKMIGVEEKSPEAEVTMTVVIMGMVI